MNPSRIDPSVRDTPEIRAALALLAECSPDGLDRLARLGGGSA
ncbi:hypothetical protein [Gordonia tangerina]|nr:hypothetical protein [Gordonia tangerina]